MSSKSYSKFFVWVLLGLLVLGLAGFGVTSLQGSLRTVGSVGEADIRVSNYFNALQNEIRAEESARGERISFAEARALGMPDRVLAQLVNQAALDHETLEMGLSIGDDNLAEQIVGIRQFTGVDGSFDREAYRFALDRVGMTEREFEDDMRRETARSFLQAGVLAGITLPETYTDTMRTYLGERRSIEWAMLGEADLQIGLPVATEAVLTTFHTENAAAYTRPAAKAITYAWITPAAILDTVEVPEDALRAAYEERREEFRQPERRLVERLVMPDEAAATDALAQIDAGETTFEALVESRGLDLADIDLGDVTEEDLGDGAAAVFAAEVGDLVGPVDTSLGPALFRVNAELAAQETSFEEAQPFLRDILAADRARRVIDAMVETVDDLLAGGATLEELAEETDMELGEIVWHPGVTEDIAAYDDFRARAGALTSDDFPEVETLEDGGIFAMRLDADLEPELRPLEEVRAAVEDAWRAQQIERLLADMAAPMAERLEARESFEDVGLTVAGSEEITRRGFIAEAPASFIEAVFEMEERDVRVIEGGGRVFLLRLNEIAPPDAEDSELAEIENLVRNQAAAGFAQDLLVLLVSDIRTRAELRLDDGALNAVHTNFQ
ncbi:MAG: SurA N-terminal domain-containing protein [Pseudomonadota bacterium]